MKRSHGQTPHLHKPRVIRPREPLTLKTLFRPVDEMLWAELQESQSLMEWLESQYSPEKPEDARALLVVKQCFNDLQLARQCIVKREKKRQSFLENNTLFWELLHQVDAEVLLLLPPHRLEARALEVLEEFKRNIKDKEARETWLGTDQKPGPLRKAVDFICKFNKRFRNKEPDAAHERELEHVRYILRAGLQAVNNHTDRTYRQLAFNVLMRDMSGILLVVLAILTYLLFKFTLPSTSDGGQDQSVGALPLVFLGAIGTIVTNMISERPLLVASGPTRRQIIYHLFMKPAIGAFAAFLFYITAESQILFTIASQTLHPERQTDGSAPILIVLGSLDAVQYAYAVLAVACGYSADRILRSTMDRVLSKLFVTADKDKETPLSTEVKPRREEQQAAV